ncbi:hypothetical protein SAMN02745166_01806 [Prosthecobacter debontii]|uniref:TonB C-terminal domain-containing protein n=1 Tax=Prosthecobacter debontii TaxID=48467 RepID=A0A1T4XS46_9BACT|nr:hypothetical protein [Prosthecobacter debontii]SKA91885.1 hypothetical protein SAMN02745166_01806 [Prosthecobacter debontii]
MSQMALLASPVVSLPTKAATAAPRVSSKPSLRLRCQDENLCALSWLVAISGTFLLIGIVGMLRFEIPLPFTLSGRAGLGAADNEFTDMSMADLLAEAEMDQVNPTTEMQQETVEIPDPIEVPIEQLDLPEVTEALVTEDLFTVPAAPKIEEALKPVDPAKPKPISKPKAVSKPTSSRAASTVAKPNGTSGNGGGGGGGGTVGSGLGKGIFPTPPFPSSAVSRGVTGVVRFNLRFNQLGKVEYAEVASSQCTNGGLTTAEQNVLSSYIRKTWSQRGRVGAITVALRFVIK